MEKRAESIQVFSTPPVKHLFTQPTYAPEGVRAVEYTSHDATGKPLRLYAWLMMPDQAEAEREAEAEHEATKRPAVVYFHSGHELGLSDAEEVRPFLDAGFAVMLPSLRGENGNPGHFEMFWGEVDDGLAAVHWLADQPEIDRERIYTFGHSAGGGISALLALADPAAPIRFGGSCGGLYQASHLREWQPAPPFESKQPRDYELRTLLDNAHLMNRPHYAYLGLADHLCENMPSASSPELHVRYVLGDHFSSLPIALADFARQIFHDAFLNEFELPDSLRPLAWQHWADIPETSVVPGHEPPKLWQVKADPTLEPLNFYRGEVSCEVMIRDRTGYHGDVVFPRGFETDAKLHALPVAPKPGVSIVDLSTMLVGPGNPNAVFPVFHKNSYSYGGSGPERFAFRWPGSNKPVDSRGIPGVTIPDGIYAASPGGRYVAAFSDQFELLVWDAASEQLVGRSPLPKLPARDGQPEGSRGRFTPAELGFSPDGKEFAAVVGEIGNMYLVNYHWESGAITAFFPTVTPWSGHRSVKYPNRYRLQFLENGHGWLVEFGKRIIDRKTGKRRGAFASAALDKDYYRIDTATFTVPRVISGNRVLAVNQNPVSLFRQRIQTIHLSVGEDQQE